MRVRPFWSRATALLLASMVLSGATTPAWCGAHDGAFGPVRAKAVETRGRMDEGQADAQKTPPKPFLKTTRGIVSVCLMAGMAAWLIQSRKSNEVVSPGR